MGTTLCLGIMLPGMETSETETLCYMVSQRPHNLLYLFSFVSVSAVSSTYLPSICFQIAFPVPKTTLHAGPDLPSTHC